MAKKAAQGTPALTLLVRSGVAHTVHAYEPLGSDSSYGMAAAEALGVPPTRVFKTLLAEVDDQLCVAVVPVSCTLDLKALAAALGRKRARMAEPAEAERSTGYVVGGISPLGQRRRLTTVVDESALDHATVYVSAGRRGLQVELSPDALVRLCAATLARLTS